MKLRDVALSTMMGMLALVTANGFKVNTPSTLLANDEIFRTAYFDAIKILGSANECSNFFGGPGSSVGVFNDLFSRAGRDYLTPSIGIAMSGETTNVVNMKTGKKHRLFDKVTLNLNGPFYRQRQSETRPTASGVGTYQANTREARVLMLLHELGHVVKEQGMWLLPDDGRSADLSRLNTRKVEAVCGDQIRNLGKANPVADFENTRQMGEQLIAAGNAP